MKIEKKEIKIKGISAIRYVISDIDDDKINIPTINGKELMNYLNNKHQKDIHKLQKKFDIYISREDFNKIGIFINELCTTYQIAIEDLKKQIKYCQSLDKIELFKIKILVDSIKYSEDQLQNIKSLCLWFKKVIVYQVNNDYYINVVISDVDYSSYSLDNLSIGPNNCNDYAPYVCEIDKLKKGYKDFVSGLKNKLENKKVIINL